MSAHGVIAGPITCTGCGNTIASDEDDWVSVIYGQVTAQHAHGCLTQVKADLTALRDGYVAGRKYADGFFAAMNYDNDAKQVQSILDLLSAGSPDVTAVEQGLRGFHDALMARREAATDGYSAGTLSNEASRVRALIDRVAPQGLTTEN